ncbi:MAG: hypothetical protein Q9163_001380 [Psora crenata]
MTERFLIALSGPTSSGKTTIATALNEVLSPSIDCTIIHADDFYKPDSEIPVNKDGVQDWDCAAALDIVKFRETLSHIKATGQVTEETLRQGNFDDGVHGSQRISPCTIARARQKVEQWPRGLLTKQKNKNGNNNKNVKSRPIVLVEGFLLFGHSVQESLAPLFDLQILLRATFAAARARRARRNGYVTLQGFWQDPPRYFEDVVWPNYMREHAWLFPRGDVEGEVVDVIVSRPSSPLLLKGPGEAARIDIDSPPRHRVRVGPVGDDVPPDQILDWVLDVVRQALEEAEVEAEVEIEGEAHGQR